MKRLLTGVAAIIALTLLNAAPAAAADEIGVSFDGTTFTPTLSHPLFDDGIRWVPGDSRSATFYVRNQGGSAAKLTVDILGQEPSDLMDTGDLSVTATGGGTSFAAARDGDQHRLLSRDPLADGQSVPVTITVAYDAASDNMTQLLSSRLDFRITLTQVARGVSDNSAGIAPAGDGDQSLPDTGAPSFTWLLAGAALLMGGGASLLRSFPTSRQDAHHG